MKFENLTALSATLLAASSFASTAAAQTDAAGLTESRPVPIAFEGGHALAVSATRQRILSQRLGYVLTVDQAGQVTDCELDYDFRLRATEIALCRPFLKHMTFEPARDANGVAVEGTYAFEVDFNMFLTQEGYLEERFR